MNSCIKSKSGLIIPDSVSRYAFWYSNTLDDKRCAIPIVDREACMDKFPER